MTNPLEQILQKPADERLPIELLILSEDKLTNYRAQISTNTYSYLHDDPTLMRGYGGINYKQ